MANVHGKNALLMLGATAVNITETTNMTFNFGADYAEDSAHGDTNKSYVPGMFDFEGSVEAHFDDAAFVLLDAAFAGTTQKLYAYPNRSTTGNYLYGTVFVTLDDFGMPMDGLVELSFSFRAAGTMTFKHV